MNDYKDFLLSLEENIRTCSSEIILAGDFNAHAPFWGSAYVC